VDWALFPWASLRHSLLDPQAVFESIRGRKGKKGKRRGGEEKGGKGKGGKDPLPAVSPQTHK